MVESVVKRLIHRGRYATHVSLAGDARKRMEKYHTPMIYDRFQRSGMLNSIDGSENHLIKIRGLGSTYDILGREPAGALDAAWAAGEPKTPKVHILHVSDESGDSESTSSEDVSGTSSDSTSSDDDSSNSDDDTTNTDDSQ